MNNNIELGIRAVSAALIVFIIVKIRQFLEELPACGCTSPAFKRIRFLELIIIVLILLNLFINPKNTGNIRAMGSSTYAKITLPIAILLYIYLTYNTVQFSNEINKNETCKKCTNKWEKYALYVQTILYGITAVVLIIASAMLINLGVVNYASSYGLMLAVGILFLLGIATTTIYGGSINDIIDIVEKNTVNEGFCGCAGKEEKKLL